MILTTMSIVMKTKCKGTAAEMEDDYNEDGTEVDKKYTNDT